MLPLLFFEGKMELPDWITDKKYYIVALALLAIASFVGVLYASSLVTLYKPSVFTFQVKELPIVVLSMSMDYDPLTDRCETVMVTVRNNGVEVISNVKITITLFSGGTPIANGTSMSFTLNPLQQANIPVQINWISGNLSMCDNGKCVIYT